MVRTTPFDDVERLAERIWNEYGLRIYDEDTFNDAYDSFIGEPMTDDQDKILRKKTFNIVAGNYPERVRKEKLFEKAGGKSMQRDRLKTSEVVVSDKKEYIKLGAGKVDLKGYDTAGDLGMIRGKIVHVKKQFVIVRKRRVVRFRDRLGRFAAKY